VKEAYPISGVTFVLMPKDGATEVDRRTVRAFARYAINEEQSATEGLYYTKLPKVLHDQGEQLLSQMTVNGQTLK